MESFKLVFPHNVWFVYLIWLSYLDFHLSVSVHISSSVTDVVLILCQMTFYAYDERCDYFMLSYCWQTDHTVCWSLSWSEIKFGFWPDLMSSCVWPMLLIKGLNMKVLQYVHDVRRNRVGSVLVMEQRTTMPIWVLCVFWTWGRHDHAFFSCIKLPFWAEPQRVHSFILHVVHVSVCRFDLGRRHHTEGSLHGIVQTEEDPLQATAEWTRLQPRQQVWYPFTHR